MKTLAKLKCVTLVSLLFTLFLISCNNQPTTQISNQNVDSNRVFVPDLPISNNPIQRAVSIENQFYTSTNNYNDIPILVDLNFNSGLAKIAIPSISLDDSVVVFKGDYENKKIIDIQVDEGLSGTPWQSTCYVEVQFESMDGCESVLVRLFSKNGDQVSLVAEKEIEDENVFNPTNPPLNIQVENFVHSLNDFQTHFIQKFSNDSSLFVQLIDYQEDKWKVIATFFDDSNITDFTINCGNIENYLIFQITGNKVQNSNRERVVHQIEFFIPKDQIGTFEKVKGKYQDSRRTRKTFSNDIKRTTSSSVGQ